MTTTSSSNGLDVRDDDDDDGNNGDLLGTMMAVMLKGDYEKEGAGGGIVD